MEHLVANYFQPYFGVHFFQPTSNWSANVTLETDDRFAQYGRLAPASKADFAFVQHMLHYLDDNGTMAVILPHGVLFRGGAEAHIREYLILEKNWLDAVIGLPANLFFGTSIPTCVLVFKKCREHPGDILFIDASAHFEQQKNQNVLRPKDIDRIVDTYRNRAEVDKYSHQASMTVIKANGCNLNIPRYVDTFKEEEPVDLDMVTTALQASQKRFETASAQVSRFTNELEIPAPIGVNIDLLRSYKRGVMQQIFSKQIRFTRDDGTAFPEWEGRKLREIAERRTTKNQGLAITRVLTNSAVKGVVDQGDYFEKDIANAENLGGYYLVELGDFVYNPRISVTAPVGPIKRNNVGTGVMSPLYTIFRMDIECITFFEQYFDSSFWHQYLKSVANYGARHDRMAIINNDFMDMPLPWPHPDEQRKIAEFLCALDAKIEVVAQQVTQTEAFKQCLLQQMFV